MTPAEQASLAIVRANHGDLDAALLMGFIEHESSFNPRAFRIDRNGGSYGLMQLDLGTAKDRGFKGQPVDLFDGTLNVQLGVAQLDWIRGYLRRRAALGLQNMIAAYNEGVGNVMRGNPDPAYVGAVMAAYSRWRVALGEGVA